MELLRTFLFAPGNHPKKVTKVFGLGADAVILDLEDAVAIDEKVATRQAIVDAFKVSRACKGYVRINAHDTPYCYGDLRAVTGEWLDGIVLPKVESAAQLLTIDWLLAQLESERGLPVGSIDLMPIIETGKGAMAVKEIAGAGSRARRLSFGAADYTHDMGMQWTLDETELTHARSEIVLASRVAELGPPIDTVFAHIGKHLDVLKQTTQFVKNLGFQGKLCIHPEQVGPINEIFTPTDKEIAKAKQIVAAFRQAETDGSASIQVDGQFVDYPIVENAKQLLAIADKINDRDVP